MKLHPSALAPRYGGHCFSDLPPTILYWLTGYGGPALATDVLGPYARRFDTVIVLFVDGFGWELYRRALPSSEFLQYLDRKGRVSKITSQFPSTTAAHVTDIHTGLTVAQSGLYEWQFYEPALDAVIAPLLFSFAGTKKRDTLLAAGVDPSAIFPTSRTLYEQLAAHGVTSYSFGYKDFTPSPYSNAVMRGARLRPFETLAGALADISVLASDAVGPTYIHLYQNTLDAVLHRHGPNSRRAEKEIQKTLAALDNLLDDLRGLPATLLVLIADHGHMQVSPQNTRYVNLDPQLSRVLPMLRTDRRGKLLPPGGSARDMFLYIQPERLGAACELLTRALRDYADVVPTSELLGEGYFGSPPFAPALLARLGNLTILPHPGNCVWWYERGKYQQKYYGHHGGLTASEIEIPLGLLDVSGS